MHVRHKSRSVTLLSLLALLTICVAQTAQALNVSGPLTINSSNSSTYTNQDIVVTAGVVTIDTPLSINSLIIKYGATITHTAGASAGLQLTVANNANINLGGAIDVSGRGNPGSTGAGAGSDNPFANPGGNASYGGEGMVLYSSGGQAGAVFGNVKSPTDLGSGGGMGSSGLYPGAAGGGAIQMTVGGTLTVDGQMNANGSTGSNAGSGSGGSMLLNIATLSGVGTIAASGGSLAGGGRIAILYTTNNIPRKKADGTSQISAPGGGYTNGYGPYYGGAGTVYMKSGTQVQGELWLNNNGNAGQGTLLPDILDPNTITFDTVYVWGQARLTPVNGGKLNFKVLGDMLVELTGFVDATDRGHGGGTGPGVGANNNGGGGGGGASYGGEGVIGYSGDSPAAGATYGDPKNPVDLGDGEHLGSGGGTGYTGTAPGGAGGGAIDFTVLGTLTVDGQILCNGQNGGNGGGGSGGSIIVNIGTLSGIGTISANGGGTSYGGPGGGGRIVVNYTVANNIPRNYIHSAGGYSNTGYTGYYAAAGTVVVKGPTQTNGELWVNNSGNYGYNNASTVLIGATTFDKVTVWGRGTLSPAYGAILTLTVLGDLTVEVDGYLSSIWRGYAAGLGTGAGANNNASSGYGGGGGGSYGGIGGTGPGGNSPTGGPTYGNNLIPTDFGSGGGQGTGNNTLYSGGAGGGSIYLIVNGTLKVDGLITVGGQNGTVESGGGAGGSLYARSGTLGGAGYLAANGGNAGANGYGNGGGGGGGRIALYSGVNNFTTANITATGGSGGSAAAGTIYQESFVGVAVSALSVAKSQVPGGQNATGMISLTGSAPSGGVTVTLTNSDPTVASVPATVTVLAGSSSATFSVMGMSTATKRTTTISAYLGGASSSVSVSAIPWIASVSVFTASIESGTSATGTITLSTPAPIGGFTVALASSDTAMTIPASVTVLAGATSTTFVVSVGTVTTEHSATITATTGVESKTTSVYLSPSTTATIKAITLTPSSVVGGMASSIGVVTLTTKAPVGGLVIALSSANTGAATVTGSVTIKAGRTSTSFVVSTKAVTTSASVAISATLGTSTKSANLTVRPAGGLASFSLNPTSVTGGDTSIGIITLDSVSSSDITVTFTSNKAQAIPDTTVVIPAGSLSAAFSIDTTSVLVKTTATITVKVGTASKTANLTINP